MCSSDLFISRLVLRHLVYPDWRAFLFCRRFSAGVACEHIFELAFSWVAAYCMGRRGSVPSCSWIGCWLLGIQLRVLCKTFDSNDT